ncbi:hypothetical protein FQU75_24485 [Paenibacillus polymyxa]|nr:hypothetical protein FQU75_24485 [Paenibacillus polymyxa]
MMDYPFQPVVGNRTEQDDKEADIFYFSKFMLTDDDDPITKYSYLLSIEAIEGVVTEEELNNLKADWSLKSDAATQYVAKQKSDALQGLNEEEKSFVERYMLESIDGKTPDPAVVATHSTFNLTADEASNKAADWMIDPRILKAIEKYKTISNKYGRDNEK